jgi:hypothetical protein
MSSINAVPVSARSMPMDARTGANGSYTLPSYAYIPHPALTQISTGHVGTPLPGAPAQFRAVPGPSFHQQFPTATLTGVYGIRQANVKTSPV